MATQPRTKIRGVPPIRPEASTQSQVQDRIRVRAYELYEQRGKAEGHDVEDWLQAEQEILPRSVSQV
jgi:hypothetical protein